MEWGKGDMLCYVSWGGVGGVGEGGHVVLC